MNMCECAVAGLAAVGFCSKITPVDIWVVSCFHEGEGVAVHGVEDEIESAVQSASTLVFPRGGEEPVAAGGSRWAPDTLAECQVGSGEAAGIKIFIDDAADRVAGGVAGGSGGGGGELGDVIYFFQTTAFL